MINKIKEVPGFRTLVQKIRNYFKDHYISFWDWKEGAKETLNPFPAILYTLNDIWVSNYYVSKDIGVVNNVYQKTKKITLWDKLLLTYKEVIKPVLFNFTWRYGNGLRSYGFTTFNWWCLTYYRDHTHWTDNRYQHSWKSKKFLFAKYWQDYDHKYILHCPHGTWEKQISQEKFNADLDRMAEEVWSAD